ncbi:MAG: DUF5615 family PIN-like protein [Campylobacterota bacterium]|nr:DUF5615 family PIN-like protein [Campylobacterota bacterium]
MCVKLLFDQNLSYRLVSRLKEEYPDSIHIAAAGLDKASDLEVWSYAKEHDYTIVTKDSDFNDLSTLYNFPPYIIWLRLGNSHTAEAERVLMKYREEIHKIIRENNTGIIEINS